MAFMVNAMHIVVRGAAAGAMNHLPRNRYLAWGVHGSGGGGA